MLLIQAIENSSLLGAIIRGGALKESSFNGYEYRKLEEFWYVVHNLKLGDFRFQKMEVFAPSTLITLTLETTDTSIFDDSPTYFGRDAHLFELEPFEDGGKEYMHYAKNLKRFQLFDKEVKIELRKIPTVGCSIKLAVIPTENHNQNI